MTPSQLAVVKKIIEELQNQIYWLEEGDGAWHIHAKMQAFELRKTLTAAKAEFPEKGGG